MQSEIKSVTITSENSDCCKTEFSYNKIDDDFVVVKTELKSFNTFEYTFYVLSFIKQNNFNSQPEIIYSDSSPPFLSNSDIYISNSVLLI
jgi:hypothetical protein